MELKAGYKQTELGQLPQEWAVHALGPLVKITSGDSPSKFKFSNEGTPYFKVEQLNNSIKYQIDTPYLIDSEKHVKKGSLIFPKRGASILLNKIRILASNAFMDTNLMALTPDEDLSGEYLYYTLSHIGLWRVADITSIPQINNKHINPLLVPIPPKDEQEAIANALSDIDQLLNNLDQLITKKRDIKKGAMQELLTGKRRLPGYSQDWTLKSFDELFSFGGGYSASRADLSQNGHCYLHYGDIHTSSKTYVDLPTEASSIPRLDVVLASVSKKSLLVDGDVVFVDASEDEEGVSKHVVIHNPDEIPYISGLHTIVAKSRDASLTRGFKRFCFQTKFVKDQFRFFAVGTKVSGISKTNIAKIQMYVPPPEEQDAIAEILSDIEDEIAALEAQREKTAALKQGMMQQLLTGKIRLT